MPPRMTTRSARRPAAALRGGGTGGRAGRGGGRTGSRSDNQGNGRNDGQGGQVGGEGSRVNDGVEGVLDFSIIIAQQLQNFLPTIVSQVDDQGRGQGNEFLASNPKEYDGKGGAVVYTRWIEKMESVQDMSSCGDNQKVKYTAGFFVATELSTIQKAMQIAGTLTDETLRNGSIKKNLEKKRNKGEPSKDRNGRDDNKRTRTINAFATTTNPVRREYTEEACQDPNIMTGTFTLNNHYATTLFDSGADYSFVSTTFIPLLGIEPNDLGFSYEIEIASGQLLEIDKVIKGCKLEIEGHAFDINFIPFRSVTPLSGGDTGVRYTDSHCTRYKIIPYIVYKCLFSKVYNFATLEKVK
nr:reverse transcriptase domain-containing protein [Tanacetum cinerariifolium]